MNPKILSKILENLYTDWNSYGDTCLPLYNCAQVNKFFFRETIPFLWRVCCRDTPGVRHLGLLARRDPQRAQIYANHIQFMEFRFFEVIFQDGMPGPVTFDVVYLDALASLKFPKLAYISIYGTGEVIEDRLLECYAHEELETVLLQGEFHGTLDAFLDTVGQRCPKIIDVNLACDGSLSVKTHSFLETHPNLEGFSLPRMHSDWTLDEFKAVCNMSQIKQLHVPRIKATWLDEMRPQWPVLDQLRTSLSNDSLDQLRISAPELGILELRLETVFTPSDIFEKLSRFTHLRLLELILMRTDEPREDCINGQDLVVTARNCPELFKLHISGENGHPRISGITDPFFDNLASNLPEVSEFVFDVDDCSSLTFNAICSLGKHCRKLREATISCDIDWKHDSVTCIPTTIPGGLFPTLYELELVVRGPHGTTETWTATDLQNLTDFVGRFMDNAPEFSSFEFKGASDTHDHIHKAFNDAIDIASEAR